MANKKPTNPEISEHQPVATSIDQQRQELTRRVKELSESTPLATIEMIQANGPDGLPTGSISAIPKDFPQPYDNLLRWPLNGVRSLWRLSVDYISDAEFITDEFDGGFITWLWARTQKVWSVRVTAGTAIDPYRTWVMAMNTNALTPFFALPVPANPRHATAEEVLRVSEMAKGLGPRSIQTLTRLDSRTVTMYESLSALSGFNATPAQGDVDLTRWQLECGLKRDLGCYRSQFLNWQRIQTWHKVIETYERAFLPETTLKRPPLVKLTSPSFGEVVDYEALTPHLERVAVELENYSHAMFRTPALDNGGKLVTAMDVAQFLGIERTSLQCSEWPDADEKGAGSRPSRWLMGTILPFLKRKYPKKKWTEFNP